MILLKQRCVRIVVNHIKKISQNKIYIFCNLKKKKIDLFPRSFLILFTISQFLDIIKRVLVIEKLIGVKTSLKFTLVTLSSLKTYKKLQI